MSGHRLGSDFIDGYSSGQLMTGDPGDAGTISPDGSHNVCEITTGGSGETRTVANAAGYPVGTMLTLVLKTDGGGACTISQAGTADDFGATADDSTQNIVLDDVGDYAVIVRQYEHQSAQIPAWRLLSVSSSELDLQENVTIDVTDTEALLVRKNGDAGDVFTVNTTAMIVSADTTLTSGGTNDRTLNLAATLNDSGAAGGSDVFRLIKGNITETDITGWDNVFLLDLQIGGVSQFRVDNSGNLVSLGSITQTHATSSINDTYAIVINSDNAGAGNPGGINLSSMEVDEPALAFVADAITTAGTASHQVAIDIGGTTYYLVAYTHGS
jgi:hypothetical protein